MAKLMNLIIIETLLLIVATTAFPQSDMTKKQSEIIHSKVLEERVNQIEEKSKMRTEHLQTQLEKQKNELKERIEDRYDIVNEKIDDRVKFITWALIIIAFFITLIGLKAIVEYVKKTIEDKVKKYLKEKKVENQLNEKIEEFEKELKIKGEDLIEILKKKGKHELNKIEALRKDYEMRINTLKDKKKIDVTKQSEKEIKDLDGFTNSLKKVKEKEQYTYDDWFYKAENEFHKGDYLDAIESFSNALKIKQEYLAYINRGLAYNIQKDYFKALEDFTEAIKMDDSNPEGYAHRSWAYLARKDDDVQALKKALKDANTAIEKDPNSVNALTIRSSVYQEMNEYEKAIEDLTKVINLNPKDTHAYITRGWYYSENENYEMAKKDFEKAIELDDKNVVAHIELCQMMIFTGNYEESLKVIDKICDLSSRSKDEALGFYLQCTIYKLLNKDTSEPERKFYDILNKEFTIIWSFTPIENWLNKSDISDESKKYINDLINLLKKKVPK